MDDAWSLSDEDLAVLQDPSAHVDESEPDSDKYDRYVYSQYDWTAGGYVPNFIPMRLRGRRDLFTATDDIGFDRMVAVNPKWYANVQYRDDENGQPTSEIRCIYAWTHTLPRRQSRMYYAHRVVPNAINLPIPVDHSNRDTLDNRSGNLKPVSRSANGSNTVRPSVLGLLAGLEYRNRAKTRVGWLIRLPGEDKKIRSEDVWSVEEQENAHLAYAEKQKELYGCGPLVEKIEPLRFPPLSRKSIIVPTRTFKTCVADDILATF